MKKIGTMILLLGLLMTCLMVLTTGLQGNADGVPGAAISVSEFQAAGWHSYVGIGLMLVGYLVIARADEEAPF